MWENYPETWIVGPCILSPKIVNSKPAIRARKAAQVLSPGVSGHPPNPEPETRNPEPGTRNPESRPQNPKPGIRNPEPETWVPKTEK